MQRTTRAAVGTRVWPGLAVLAVGALLTAPACNIVAPVGYLLTGAEKVPRMYDLDRNRPTVVLVDDRVGRVPSRAARRQIGMSATDLLLTEGKMTQVIESQAALEVVERERFGKPMGIAEVGDAVGAEIVIYAQVDSFALEDGKTFAPSSAVRVKVVDAKAKTRLWPTGGVDDWYRLEVRLPTRQGSPPRSLGDRTKAEQDLAERVGRSIAYLFIRHEANPIDGKVNK